jgi:hypothetical protein
MESCPSKEVENLREKLVEENFYLITEVSGGQMIRTSPAVLVYLSVSFDGIVLVSFQLKYIKLNLSFACFACDGSWPTGANRVSKQPHEIEEQQYNSALDLTPHTCRLHCIPLLNTWVHLDSRHPFF